MSLDVLVPGLAASFDTVPGDPEQLRAAARALRGVAGDLSGRCHEVDGAVERTTAAWAGRRSLDFRLAASGVTHALEASVRGVADLADALDELAAAAQVARDEVDQQASRARRVAGEVEDRVRAMAPGDTRIESEREHAAGGAPSLPGVRPGREGLLRPGGPPCGPADRGDRRHRRGSRRTGRRDRARRAACADGRPRGCELGAARRVAASARGGPGCGRDRARVQHARDGVRVVAGALAGAAADGAAGPAGADRQPRRRPRRDPRPRQP